MLFDLNILMGQARYKDEKFLRVWNWFTPTDLPRAWAWELAVLLRTPGFGIDQLRIAFQWHPSVVFNALPEILEYFDDPSWNIRKAARANFESISPEDGIDWLLALRETRKSYSASVPLCTSDALRQLRANGLGRAEIASRYDVPRVVITKAWLEDRFDPFTGKDTRCPSYWPFETYC